MLGGQIKRWSEYQHFASMFVTSQYIFLYIGLQTLYSTAILFWNNVFDVHVLCCDPETCPSKWQVLCHGNPISWTGQPHAYHAIPPLIMYSGPRSGCSSTVLYHAWLFCHSRDQHTKDAAVQRSAPNDWLPNRSCDFSNAHMWRVSRWGLQIELASNQLFDSCVMLHRIFLM